MKIQTALLTILASVAVCHLHAVNISGTVKDGNGSGLDGVSVRLGKSGLATTTASDGSFTLKDGTSLEHRIHQTHPRTDRLILLKDDRLFFFWRPGAIKGNGNCIRL